MLYPARSLHVNLGEAYCPPPAPPPIVFSDVLPAPAGQKPAAIRFTPGSRPVTGLVCIQVPGSRCVCEYLVRELPTGWDGRAVQLAKVEGSPGSDPEEASYEVYVARNGQDRRCDCKGFTRWGRSCKHIDTVLTLVQNGWLDLELSNPDADVGDTEPPADQPEPDLPDPEDFIDPADDAAAEEWLTAPRPDVEPIDWTDVPF